MELFSGEAYSGNNEQGSSGPKSAQQNRNGDQRGAGHMREDTIVHHGYALLAMPTVEAGINRHVGINVANTLPIHDTVVHGFWTWRTCKQWTPRSAHSHGKISRPSCVE